MDSKIRVNSRIIVTCITYRIDKSLFLNGEVYYWVEAICQGIKQF
jgi:hypothetical protein